MTGTVAAYKGSLLSRGPVENFTATDQNGEVYSFEDEVEGWPPYTLTVFWGAYDGKQAVRCREGQDLRFVRREDAPRYDIPPQLLPLWDQALAKAGIDNRRV